MHDTTGFRLDPVDDPATRLPRNDPNFTEAVIAQTGPNANPRLAELFAAFTRHMHTLCREKNVTAAEFQSVMSFLARAADDKSLMILAAPLGLHVLCDEATFKINTEGLAEEPTHYTGPGPFYRPGGPMRELGMSVVDWGFEQADHILMHGKIIDAKSGVALPNAEVDFWQAGANGLYDHEDPEQPTWNLRGRFKSSQDGSYSFICLRPSPYPVPTASVAGDFLRMLDRHPFRPGHLHFKVTAKDCLPLVTELYVSSDKYLNSDVVFDVHDSLIMQLEPASDKNAKGYKYEMKFDFKLISNSLAKEQGMKAAEEWIQGVLEPY